MVNKSKRLIFPEYISWIKTQPCRVTMQNGCDAHHVIGILPGGMATKVHDIFTIPLTRDKHTILHHYGVVKGEEVLGINQAEEVLAMINKAINEGFIDIRWIK